MGSEYSFQNLLPNFDPTDVLGAGAGSFFKVTEPFLPGAAVESFLAGAAGVVSFLLAPKLVRSCAGSSSICFVWGTSACWACDVWGGEPAPPVSQPRFWKPHGWQYISSSSPYPSATKLTPTREVPHCLQLKHWQCHCDFSNIMYRLPPIPVIGSLNGSTCRHNGPQSILHI